MKAIRATLCLLTALVLAVFALPSGAASTNKNYTLVMSPTSLAAGSNSVSATFTNTSPPTSNSSINSVELWVPAPFLATDITSSTSAGSPLSTADIAPSSVVANATTIAVVTESGQLKIKVSNLSPINSGGLVKISFSLNVPANACSGYNWNGVTWSGSNFSGQQFALQQPPASTLLTATLTGCHLAWVTQPSNGLKNTALTPAVQVALEDSSNTVQTWFTSAVTLSTLSGPNATLTGSTVAAQSGTATFSFLALDTLGTYTLQAKSSGLTSDASNAFTIYGGTLDCGDKFGSTSTDPGNAGGDRSSINKDGVTKLSTPPCRPVDYTFDTSALSTGAVHLSWDVTPAQGQPNAAFEYDIYWPAKSVDPTTGWPSYTVSGTTYQGIPQPQVAWLDTSGNPLNVTGGTPAYMPGLACLSDQLPAPYGNLAASVATGAGSIKISGVAYTGTAGSPTLVMPPTPFPVVIADYNPVQNSDGSYSRLAGTERMTATGSPTIDGTCSSTACTVTYSVTRGTSAEGYASGYQGTGFHAQGAAVMSTPLPIIASTSGVYAAGTQAQMCIVTHGWSGYGNDGSGNALIAPHTKVFDIGDGVITFR